MLFELVVVFHHPYLSYPYKSFFLHSKEAKNPTLDKSKLIRMIVHLKAT